MRRHTLQTFAATLLVLSLPGYQPAFAWGHVGHAVVADIAQAHLTPAAAEEVKRLLATEGAHRLSDISSWADQVKGDDLPNRPAHTLRLPLDGGDPPPHPCPSHFCADDGIAFWSKVLADPKQPDDQRETALKYIVHLVGDLQQPLHDTDAGGANLNVIFEGKDTQLHKVWDEGIIESQAGKNPAEIAKSLIKSEAGVPSGGTPMDWAIEGREIAQKQIYDTIPRNPSGIVRLPANYAAQKWPIVQLRLTEGGLRLARILNQLLTPYERRCKTRPQCAA
jgi:hypothetical protein